MQRKHPGSIPRGIQERLAEAEQVCAKRGGNMTPLRRRLLNYLLESERPVKAYDLLDRLKGDQEAKPPTVYRTLDFLEEKGLIHRIASLQAFTPCQNLRHAHTPALLLCDMCGKVTEIDAGGVMSKLTQEAATVTFKSHSALIEVHGTCPDCEAWDGGARSSKRTLDRAGD